MLEQRFGQLRRQPLAGRAATEPCRSAWREIVERAEGLLRQRYTEPMRLGDVARELDVNRSRVPTPGGRQSGGLSPGVALA